MTAAPFGGRPIGEWTEWELRAAEELARRANAVAVSRGWAQARLCELAGERWRRDGSPLAPVAAAALPPGYCGLCKRPVSECTCV